MRILITGAGGLVGSALARRFRNDTLFALGHRDLDIAGPDVMRTVKGLRPDIIFNCAVIGVDDCERNPDLAEAVNVAGPRALASAAPKIVHFSTNYVFEGQREPSDPYAVHDDARPVNVYGHTKLAGERAVAEACAQSFIVRTSWVFGEGKDSFLSAAARKLAAGERLRTITDIWANTTWVEDLVDVVVKLDKPGVYQIANEGALTHEMFARECARLVGADPSLIDRISESDMKRDAKRPRVTPMVCEPKLRSWQEALREYCAPLPHRS